MSQTGADDQTYNVVSILYHALEGAATYQQYVNDAGSGDLADFFREAQQQQQQLAERAQEMLKQQLG